MWPPFERYNLTMNQPTESPIALAVYRERRERLLAALRAAGGGVAIVQTAPELARNRDSDYPYRHDSYFYYLSGFTEPQAFMVLDAEARDDEPASVLFCRPKNAERETWEGFHFGPEAAREAFGFDAAFSIDEIDAQMPRLLADAPALHYLFAQSAGFDGRLRGWLDAVRAQSRSGVVAPVALVDLTPRLDDMRLFKDAHELAIMRRAAHISAEAHRRAMSVCRPGMREYELEAELLYTFRRHGAQSPAYGSIVAAGANAACFTIRPAMRRCAMASSFSSTPRASSTATHRTSHVLSRQTGGSLRRSGSYTISCSPRSKRPSMRRAPV